MIYISTGGFKDISFDKAIENLKKSGIENFELSGGSYVDQIENKVINLANEFNLSLHNYFPPKKNPFVFNLASLDKKITQESIKHAEDAIKLCSKINSKFFSFHAGYLIDPQVDELGNKIKKRSINNRKASKNLFIERVNKISKLAKDYDVKILIENNVISQKNFKEFEGNPLLMTETLESLEIMKKTDGNVGLLLDVAHLKVSSKTLGFCAEDFIDRLSEHTFGYHLSDNDGVEDSNELILNNSWFWPYIKNDADYYSIEVYNADRHTLKKQLELVKNKLIK